MKRTRRQVVLVHGIWNTAGIFSSLSAYLERTGYQVHALSMQPNNGDAPLEQLAQQVAVFVEQKVPPTEPFDLVGFSMGGLVSRYYVQRLGGIKRVRRFVTVSAPHRGTVLGWFSRRYGVRQMRPGSAFIRSLNKDVDQLKTIQFYSLWTPFDLLILPPWSSRINVAWTQMIKVPSHNRMIRDASGLAAIAQALVDSDVPSERL